MPIMRENRSCFYLAIECACFLFIFTDICFLNSAFFRQGSLATFLSKSCPDAKISYSPISFVFKVIQAMDIYITPYVDQLLQLFLGTLKDADDEVISNSVFAIGVLAESGKEHFIKYPFLDIYTKLQISHKRVGI